MDDTCGFNKELNNADTYCLGHMRVICGTKGKIIRSSLLISHQWVYLRIFDILAV